MKLANPLGPESWCYSSVRSLCAKRRAFRLMNMWSTSLAGQEVKRLITRVGFTLKLAAPTAAPLCKLRVLRDMCKLRVLRDMCKLRVLRDMC